jgi:alkylation response protein AidB-like acyl-CoA dehydrogenase
VTVPIGISEDHREVAKAFGTWAASVDGIAVARAAEDDPEAPFTEAMASAAEMGLFSIVADGGTLLDLAVAVESCAGALVPGPVLGTAVAAAALGDVGDKRFALALSGEVVHGAAGSTHALVVVDDEVRLVSLDGLDLSAGTSLDLTRRTSIGRLEGGEPTDVDAGRLRALVVTLAAAEASGVARWCLDTAVSYAGVREQFGKKIGAFQSIKHLCAEMLETSEVVTAAAWDAARAYGESSEAFELAATVAGVVAVDGAVEVAKSCIQVLGGIGFTFEHDAHLYLRRVLALRAMLPTSGATAEALAGFAADGRRRTPHIDLDDLEELREEVRAEAQRIAGLPEAERRAALAESGLLTPHWPEPYGRAAEPAEQLVVDEELEAAGVQRPDLQIGAWAAPTIIGHGDEDQRERFIAPTLTGEIVWCQLFSEPGAGSDLASLRTKAVRDAHTDGQSGWRLTGQKVWTSMAEQADWGICLARTDPDAEAHAGITYFLVDMTSDGIDVRPLRELTGLALFNEVFLDGVFVPDECVVGEVGGGWKLARTTLANERVAMAGSRLGASVERAIDLLGEHPEARVEVGRAVALATVVKLLGTRATLRSMAGHGPGPESSVAKLVGVRSRQDSSELVVRLLGDRVFTDDDLVKQALHEMLNNRCLSIAGGTTQVLRNVAGERILGLPRG